jgi:hypothetical protein
MEIKGGTYHPIYSLVGFCYINQTLSASALSFRRSAFFSSPCHYYHYYTCHFLISGFVWSIASHLVLWNVTSCTRTSTCTSTSQVVDHELSYNTSSIINSLNLEALHGSLLGTDPSGSVHVDSVNGSARFSDGSGSSGEALLLIDAEVPGLLGG